MKIKDKRAKAARDGRNFQETIAKALDGDMSDVRPGSEQAAMKLLTMLIQLYIAGEGPITDAISDIVDCLMNREDPVVKDIPAELRAVIWPSLNTLRSARRAYLGQAKQEHGTGALGTGGGSEASGNEGNGG